MAITPSIAYQDPSHLLAGAPISGTETITNPALSETLQNLLNEPFGFFTTFIPLFINLAFIIGALIFFAMIIIGAIQWISSGGEKEGLAQARQKISNAIIGLIVLFTVFAIMSLIEVFFGIDLLLIDLTPLII